jgi:hypothetical protein
MGAHRGYKNKLDLQVARNLWKGRRLCKVAENIKKRTELIEAGFDYVCEMANVLNCLSSANKMTEQSIGKSWGCML